jgi:hypothetical protein
MSNIAVGTRRQYAEQSLKWDAAVASEKSDDELLQRIWNLSEDSLHVIAALTAAEAEVARWREGYGPELQELETLQTEVARLAQGVTAQAEEARMLREAAMALYERVQMDESVGICLSERVTTLALGAALAKEDAS